MNKTHSMDINDEDIYETIQKEFNLQKDKEIIPEWVDMNDVYVDNKGAYYVEFYQLDSDTALPEKYILFMTHRDIYPEMYSKLNEYDSN